jgi:Flp pilus assembly protein TadD
MSVKLQHACRTRAAAVCGLLLLACAHPRQAAFIEHRTPAVDVSAADEARESFEPQRYVSARAYRHYLDALLARGADDYATAASELREALIYDPESPHLHTVLADVLLRQGRVADAEEELRSALALDASHAPALLMLARIAEARERPEEARKQLRAARAGEPGNPDAWRESVRLELALGNLAAAEELAGQLSEASRAAQRRAERQQHDEESDPERGAALVTADRMRDGAAGAWVDVGRAFVQRHDGAGAQRAFAQARAAQPSDPEALSAEASFLESQRKFAEARELYLRLLAQRPEAPEVLAGLARLALEEGDLDTERAHARKLLGLAAGALAGGDSAARRAAQRGRAGRARGRAAALPRSPRARLLPRDGAGAARASARGRARFRAGGEAAAGARRSAGQAGSSGAFGHSA